MNTKNLKINKKTISITLETSEKEVCNLDRYEAVSIALLNGFYNPLRKFSKTSPIDLDKLEELKRRYRDLINEVIMATDVDVESIEKIS